MVGIEVELEAFRGDLGELVYWRMEHDGSLREGGVEFVLRQPLTGFDLEKAINELYDKVLQNCKYESNIRTSTHIHIDVRDISTEHLRRIVFFYAMFERFIYDMVSPEREFSFYCAPLFSSVQNRRRIAESLDSHNFRRCPKYSGLNLKSINNYGSLEFRMHQGMTKETNLRTWIALLLKLKTGTKAYEDVPLDHILRLYSENSAEVLLEQILGFDMFNKTVKNRYNERLKGSMRSAQDMLLLRRENTLKQMERQWYREYNGQKGGDIEGIDPEVLEILRNRRDEILNQ
ncbi:MAG: amidoligase family protein [Gammaproteobacteria bacterium]|nr:amidoligase family protein [Gammaproteobacteria bacterium]